MADELMIRNEEDQNFIADLTGEHVCSYCSFTPETIEQKAHLYNLMSEPEFRIGDCINKIINVQHVYVESVPCTNVETGEVRMCPRVILIDNEGHGYQSVSVGVFSSVKRIFAMFGEPAYWEKPIPIEIKQVTKGKNKMLTLKVAL